MGPTQWNNYDLTGMWQLIKGLSTEAINILGNIYYTNIDPAVVRVMTSAFHDVAGVSMDLPMRKVCLMSVAFVPSSSTQRSQPKISSGAFGLCLMLPSSNDLRAFKVAVKQLMMKHLTSMLHLENSLHTMFTRHDLKPSDLIECNTQESHRAWPRLMHSLGTMMTTEICNYCDGCITLGRLHGYCDKLMSDSVVQTVNARVKSWLTLPMLGPDGFNPVPVKAPDDEEEDPSHDDGSNDKDEDPSPKSMSLDDVGQVLPISQRSPNDTVVKVPVVPLPLGSADAAARGISLTPALLQGVPTTQKPDTSALRMSGESVQRHTHAKTITP